MSDDVKPAMTPEQWQHVAAVGMNASVTIDPQFHSVHTVAALALHGQPFGFTREDVEFLRGMVDSDTNPDTAPVEANAALDSLATRIEALLPPDPREAMRQANLADALAVVSRPPKED